MTTAPLRKMNNGLEIDQIGLGMWENKDEEICNKAIATALECGYRHFDTAQTYCNEEILGEALQTGYKTIPNLKREDLFITTKLWNDNQYFKHVWPSFEISLENLQTDYVDLFLVHFPVTELRRPAWTRMQEILESGKAKSIGVSNYTIKHLEELLRECDVKPAINQVEIHVYLQQKELRDYCAENDILIEAYSPLAHGNGLDNEVLVKIAAKHNKTTAQIMIKWCLEMNLVVIPKSSTPSRIIENIDVFDFKLDPEDLSMIADLERNYRTCWDPTNVS